MTKTVTFEKYGLKVKFSWNENGKRKQRTESFFQTQNPWNKKSIKQIKKETMESANKWVEAMREKHGNGTAVKMIL